MEIRRWNGVGDYDYFITCSKDEAAQIFRQWDDIKVHCPSFDATQFFFLINIDRSAVAPLPTLSLAFGGLYNGYPPYGKPVKIMNPIRKISQYELEPFQGYEICKGKPKILTELAFRFFARKKTTQLAETIIYVGYGNSFFSITQNEKNAYCAYYGVNWLSKRQLNRGPLYCIDKIPCSLEAVGEAFDLLNRYEIVDLLEDVRQSTFRDIECDPPFPIRVEWHYADVHYRFEDFYGCCYEKSCDTNTQLVMTSLMLKFAELFRLIQQEKI